MINFCDVYVGDASNDHLYVNARTRARCIVGAAAETRPRLPCLRTHPARASSKKREMFHAGDIGMRHAPRYIETKPAAEARVAISQPGRYSA